MSEKERLEGLVKELTSDEAYATGRRRFPRSLPIVDAVTISARLQDALDEAVVVRERKATEDGLKIACGPGCNYCCEQLVMVWLPEAHRIAEWLRAPERAAARQAFLEAYPRWKEQVGDAPDRIAELTAQMKKGEHLDAHIAQWRQRVLCAFNRDGLCTIYEARPLVCRNCHALDTNEHCRGDTSSMIPARIKFEPLDDFAAYASTLNIAMHHALGGPRRRTKALCQAVYDLIKL
jgi:Fe-S-cluster containining protein